ncbi:MAG: acyl carrier protein [Bacteroidales bacterium]|nr:acyl carrier protein [Bacteroidales bacterium]
MNEEEITARIIAITEDHFKDYHKKVGPETTSADIPAWNSLNHVMLMARIEKEFNIKFDILQMIEMRCVGDIARATGKLMPE